MHKKILSQTEVWNSTSIDLQPGFETELFNLYKVLIECSRGRIRFAFQEGDTTKDHYPCIDLFLKMDERRLGYDLKVYTRIIATTSTPFEAYIQAMGNIFLPVRKEMPEIYRTMAGPIKELGLSLIDPVNTEKKQHWSKIFDL